MTAIDPQTILLIVAATVFALGALYGAAWYAGRRAK